MGPEIRKSPKFSHSNRRKRDKLTRRQSELHRTSIDVAKTLKALQNHRDGKVKLDPSQIRACEILLDRAMPRLSAQELQATVQDERTETMTDAQLVAIAGGKKD